MNKAEESLGYPLEEVLADVERWVEGSTMYHGIRGWRPACAVLACEVERLRKVLNHVVRVWVVDDDAYDPDVETKRRVAKMLEDAS